MFCRLFASLSLAITVITASLLSSSTARLHADEGMYLFNDLPRELLKERYDFDPSQKWADDLRLASVRFNSGGSGSFVSSNGLVLTNHHVASDTLQKVSTQLDSGWVSRQFVRRGDQSARPGVERAD